MAEPSWFVPVPPGEVWDPLVNVSPPGQPDGDWEEEGALEQPGGSESYTREQACVTIRGFVPWKKRYDMRRKALGYSFVPEDGSLRLCRVNPLPCPDEGHLRCVAVDYNGFNIMGRDQAADGSPPKRSAQAPNAALPAVRPAGLIRLPNRVNYTRAVTTLKFRDLPYPLLEDADMVSYVTDPPTVLPEYYRNTQIFESCQPIWDIVTADSSQGPFLFWKDDPANGMGAHDNTGPPKDQGLTAPMPEYISRATLTMVWTAVPGEYLVGDDYLPSKIMSAVGCVNDEDDWLGVFPRGTLRMDAPRFRRSVQGHIRTDPAAYHLSFVYDVEFTFSWIDPTPAPVVGGYPSYRGWNLLLWSTSGKWYSVKRKHGAPYFPFAPFDEMFTHVDS